MCIRDRSFGFKYGSPSEADLVFDVRCLPNPFYIDELRNQTGLNKPVRDYVMQCKETKGFVERFFSMIDYMLPLYINEGKSQLEMCIRDSHFSMYYTSICHGKFSCSFVRKNRRNADKHAGVSKESKRLSNRIRFRRGSGGGAA